MVTSISQLLIISPSSEGSNLTSKLSKKHLPPYTGQTMRTAGGRPKVSLASLPPSFPPSLFSLPFPHLSLPSFLPPPYSLPPSLLSLPSFPQAWKYTRQSG